MSKWKDMHDQSQMLALNKAEAEREMEIAEQEYAALSALRRLDVLIGRAKAVQFVQKEYTSLPF